MQPQQESWEPKPLLLTIEETARSLRLSRAKVYALIRSQDFTPETVNASRHRLSYVLDSH